MVSPTFIFCAIAYFCFLCEDTKNSPIRSPHRLTKIPFPPEESKSSPVGTKGFLPWNGRVPPLELKSSKRETIFGTRICNEFSTTQTTYTSSPLYENSQIKVLRAARSPCLLDENGYICGTCVRRDSNIRATTYSSLPMTQFKSNSI